MFKLQETQLKSWRGYRSGFIRFNFSHTLRYISLGIDNKSS